MSPLETRERSCDGSAGSAISTSSEVTPDVVRVVVTITRRERTFEFDVFDLPRTCLLVGHWSDTHLNTKSVTFNNRMPFATTISVAWARSLTLSHVEAPRDFFLSPVFVAVETLVHDSILLPVNDPENCANTPVELLSVVCGDQDVDDVSVSRRQVRSVEGEEHVLGVVRQPRRVVD